ncbi:MAG: response regulator [Deltaproteobacteria bacterium]|nr:response regulator [Deltaproteobacteria bacterium]MBT6434756.1 response regulator [Deltaproteobacteria bacterium]
MNTLDYSEPGAGSEEPNSEVLEQKYKEYLSDLQSSRAKIGYWVIFIWVPLGSLRDLINTPDLIHETVTLRIITTLIAILLFFFFFEPSRKHLAHHSILAAALCILFMNEVGIITTGSFSNQLYFGPIIVLLTTGFLSCWPPKAMIALGAITPFIYCVPGIILFENIDYDTMIQHTYLIALAGALATMTCHYEYKLRKEEFHSRYLLSEKTKQLELVSSELQSTVTKLQKTDAAKTRFFANITHELKTPLTMILLPLDGILKNNASLKPATRDKLNILKRQAQQLLTLVNDILTLAQLDHDAIPASIRHVDATTFTRYLLSGYQPLADEENIELLFSGSPSPATLDIDPQHLQTILNNLIINAFKYSDAGGQIDVHIRVRADQCVFVVRDSGTGITKEDLPHIFNRFVQSENPSTKRGGGFGIGLSLADELVRLHQGSIKVESSKREGTKFIVSFPRVQEAPNHSPIDNFTALTTTQNILAGKAKDTGAYYPPTNASRERVLIVEDNDELRLYLKEQLEPYYTIFCATSHQAALEYIHKSSPDLVLSDVMMPGLSGFELLRQIRETYSMTELPCILLTARGEDENIESSMDAGANDYITKPFNLNTLMARIEVQLRLKAIAQDLARERVASAMGALASGLAHELRNPLNVVLNGLPNLRSSIEPVEDSKTSKILQILEQSSGKISNLIDELIRFGTDELALSVWEPNVALMAAWQSEKKENSNINIKFSLEYTGSIQAFGSKVDESVHHLLRNAISAAGPDGNITLATKSEDGGVSIVVSDDGPGIAPELAQRIFDPFFTTQTETNAAGLGLHMVQWVTRLHGGHIGLETQLGQGSQFIIWLPKIPQRADKNFKRDLDLGLS